MYSREGGGGGECGAGIAGHMKYRIPRILFIMGYDGQGAKGSGFSISEMR